MSHDRDFWIVEDIPKEDGNPTKFPVQNQTRQHLKRLLGRSKSVLVRIQLGFFFSCVQFLS